MEANGAERGHRFTAIGLVKEGEFVEQGFELLGVFTVANLAPNELNKGTG